MMKAMPSNPGTTGPAQSRADSERLQPVHGPGAVDDGEAEGDPDKAADAIGREKLRQWHGAAEGAP